MKRTIYLSVIMLMAAFSANSQFIEKPLNFPGAGYYPSVISIVDHTHCWFGVARASWLPYSFSVHTNDGGETFIFDSIPVGGLPVMQDACAVDSLTCYYAMTDSFITFSIWKTTDGGNSWQKKTTIQFLGGYLNDYYAFSADTGVAIGNPNSGYFEIQVTNDGGDTWARVPSANIPAMQDGETAFRHQTSAIGNTIWFPTNKGRCFKSVDKGLNWTVSSPMPSSEIRCDVKFSSPDIGVFHTILGDNIFYKTADGGVSWVVDTLPFNDMVMFMSSVQGFSEGFIFTTHSEDYSDNVYFTPDFFNTVILIQSGMTLNGTIRFKDAATGWLGGLAMPTNDIFYFTDVLTSVSDAVKTPEKLAIIPNPSSGEALVKIPASLDSKSLRLVIIDMNGKILEQHAITCSTGWTKLNAAGYANGNYIVEILSEDRPVASQQWIVNH
jgi:hypothetical protein